RKEWETKKPTWAGPNFGDALTSALAQAGVPNEKVDLDEVFEVYDWSPFPGVAPFADTHSVLKALKANGYKIGLITNAFQPMYMRDVELERYDLLKYLDARITSGDTRFMKPHPAIYWRMLGLLDLMPEDAVMVGDRPGHDVLGAHNTGMLGVLMSPPHLNRPLEGVKPDYIVNALSELLPILEELD
ncbi:MAG: HAD family hydrolase, partial [Chloroflexota bacterium]